ncbi:MAG: GTPase Era [Rhodospirillales bacterium]|nr:GTPase Era [Rhodospirillales bacterium]
MSEAGRACGFVALIGAPNAGKSTLLNRFVGAKVSIVSPKVQTTRARVLGIRIEGKTQIVFIDTPGIFRPRRRLDRAMVAAAWGGAGDADHICLLVDATRFRGGEADPDTRRIVGRLKETGGRAVLAINKIDAVAKPALLEMAAVLDGEGVFSETFMVSAAKGGGTADLLSHLTGMMAPGPWLFPEDQISDMPQRLLAAEITREKLYLQLHQELPYAATVETDSWEEQEDGSARIEQTIYVERDSQKAIVLGKGGARIRQLGAAARAELQELLDRRIHLFLFVKVRDNWGDDPARYRDWGLDYNA